MFKQAGLFIGIGLGGAICTAGVWHTAQAQEGQPGCPAMSSAPVSISADTVYRKGDPSQSHIDEGANAAYRQKMAPLWDFIKAVSQQASAFVSRGDRRAGVCAIASLDGWAKAGALTDQRTQSVQLNMGRNLSGLALSYAKVRGLASDEQKKSIDDWLHDLARRIPGVFDSIANTDTSKGNLRYWNGLAAMSVGELVGDRDLVSWGDDSLHVGLCQADPDGALPIEMHRAGRAMFYQLYATAPLVTMAVHAKRRGSHPEAECGGSLARIVAFTVAGGKDTSIVQKKAGAPQDSGPYKTFSSAFAWIDLYEGAFGAIPGLAGVTVQRPLFDSALGGDTSGDNH